MPALGERARGAGVDVCTAVCVCTLSYVDPGGHTAAVCERVHVCACTAWCPHVGVCP